MQGNYEMFSDEGNDAVHQALNEIHGLSQDHTKVWNRETLSRVAIHIILEVAKKHGEVYDTEPRGHIADFLDQLCEENGWAYSPYDSYNW